MSVFAKYEDQCYPFRYNGSLIVRDIFGGVPSDPKVAEGWIKTKLAPRDDLIREMVAEVMVERGVTAEEAAKIVDTRKHLNGFKRDDSGLYIEGRQLKAALKEAVSVAANAGKIEMKGWGSTKKYLTTWFPEHVFVIEDRLPLGVTEPSRIEQDFIHTFRGNGIQLSEVVDEAKITFTVEADYLIEEKEWAAIWLTGQRQGLGASRSQGRGRYEIITWDQVDVPAAKGRSRKVEPAA